MISLLNFVLSLFFLLNFTFLFFGFNAYSFLKIKGILEYNTVAYVTDNLSPKTIPDLNCVLQSNLVNAKDAKDMLFSQSEAKSHVRFNRFFENAIKDIKVKPEGKFLRYATTKLSCGDSYEAMNTNLLQESYVARKGEFDIKFIPYAFSKERAFSAKNAMMVKVSERFPLFIKGSVFEISPQKGSFVYVFFDNRNLIKNSRIFLLGGKATVNVVRTGEGLRETLSEYFSRSLLYSTADLYLFNTETNFEVSGIPVREFGQFERVGVFSDLSYSKDNISKVEVYSFFNESLFFNSYGFILEEDKVSFLVFDKRISYVVSEQGKLNVNLGVLKFPNFGDIFGRFMKNCKLQISQTADYKSIVVERSIEEEIRKTLPEMDLNSSAKSDSVDNLVISLKDLPAKKLFSRLICEEGERYYVSDALTIYPDELVE